MEDFQREIDDVSEIARRLNDVILELSTLEDQSDRTLRCRALLEDAILAGSVNSVRAIFRHPQIAQYVDRNGGSGGRDSCPALVSLRTDCAEVLKVLVEEQGADVFGCNVTDAQEDTTTTTTSSISSSDRNRVCGGGSIHSSVFVAACRDGRLNCIRYLLSLLVPLHDVDVTRGCSVTSTKTDDVITYESGTREARGRKVVYYGAVAAVENDIEEVLRVLLEAGSLDINAVVDNDIGTVMHVAAQCNSVRCTRLLLSWSSTGQHPPRKMDIEIVATDRQQTALMKAAEHNSIEVMKMLLAAGADIDRQTHGCSTALIISCHFGHMQCVQLLLAHGANPHVKNHWGFTALYMGTDTPGILERMLREPVDVNEHCGERQEVALHLATVIGSVDAINSLLDRGANINLRTIYNENALWLAVWKDHTDASRVLIQNNIDLDAESNGCQVYIWYYQPIEVALGLCNYDVVHMLLLAGCSLHNRRYYRADTDPGPLADVGLPWVQLRSEAFDFIREDRPRFQWLKETLTTATTMKNSCRRTVRRLLRIPIAKKIKQLPIPKALQDYLMMNDL